MKKKLTPWFPHGTYPAHIGYYIASVTRGYDFYRYWDGRTWFYGGETLEQAIASMRNPERWPLESGVTWRGLAVKP